MEVVVTTGAIRRAKLQSNRHHQKSTPTLLQAGCHSCRQLTVSKHWRKVLTYMLNSCIILCRIITVNNCWPADVVDAMLLICTKSDHQNKTNRHHRPAICETRRQQQAEWIYNEWWNEQNVPDTVHSSQLLSQAATCRLARVVRQHWHNVNIPTRDQMS